MHIAVFGGGSWGTALANMLARKGRPTTLWVRSREHMAAMQATRENASYLPGVTLADGLDITDDAPHALHNAEALLFAVPTQHFRSILVSLRDHMRDAPLIVCANKGIEVDTLKTNSDMVQEELGGLTPRYAMLSGPSFAEEVAAMLPTAIVLGCGDPALCGVLQEALSTDYFRVYTNPDVRGVELGGAVKNIMAIAAGISDGLGFGANARAALITRGLAEMSRLGKAMGGDPTTFMGLAGMGDLVLTCTGDLSRNRQVGLKLGQGLKLADILAEMQMVAEGVKTTEAVHRLGRSLRVELPITEQVHAVLYNDKDPREATSQLMRRELREE